MMHGHEKSRSAIVAVKPTNKVQWVQGPPGNRSLQKSLTVRWAVRAPRSGSWGGRSARKLKERG